LKKIIIVLESLRKKSNNKPVQSGNTVSRVGVANKTEIVTEKKKVNAQTAKSNNNNRVIKDSTTIVVRMLNGEVVRQNFPLNATLKDVVLYIDQNQANEGEEYTMRTTFPPRIFNDRDLILTLQQLELFPSGTIILSVL